MSKQDIVFGKRLKRLRKQSGLTQEKLSELAGVGEKYISLIENGRKRPSTSLIYRLARSLQIKPKELF